MIVQGSIITLLGMAAVFAFLSVLVGALRLLSVLVPRMDASSDRMADERGRRIAAAVAAASAFSRKAAQ